MTQTNEENFIQEAFQKLIARGIIHKDAIRPSTATDTDIAAYERRFGVTLSPFFKTFLKSYSYQFTRIAAPVPEDIVPATIQDNEEDTPPYIDLQWLELISIPRKNPLKDLSCKMEGFRSLIASSYKLLGVTLDDVKNFVPIGDWGAGWGPLFIDLAKPDEAVDINDERTWNLVWFDHEEFPWKEPHVEAQDIPVIAGAGFTMSMGHYDYCRRPGGHSTPLTLSEIERSDKLRDKTAAPNFKTLLEWYFCGKFDKAYEIQLKNDGKKMPNYSKYIASSHNNFQ